MIGDFKNRPGLNLDPDVGPGTQIIDRSSGFRRYGIDAADYARGMERVNAYQRALAMADWTLFAPLDFRRWTGRATHFRDAERSAKVEGDGDPLGLVDPLVGEPLVQPVSAERPVWTEEGAVFDAGPYLDIPVSTYPNNELSFPLTFLMDLDHTHQSEENEIFLIDHRNSTGSGRVGVTIQDTSGRDAIAVFYRNDGESMTRHSVLMEEIDAGFSGQVAVAFGTDEVRLYMDGILVDVFETESIVELTLQNVTIGTRADANVGFLDGRIRFAAIAPTALTDTQIAHISDLLL